MSSAIPRRSITAEHLDIGAVRAMHLAVYGDSHGIASGSTTDTVGWTTIAAEVVAINTPRAILSLHGLLTMKHTVADSIIDVRVTICDDALGTTVLASDRRRNTLLPAPANVWYGFALYASFDIEALGIPQGFHLVRIELGPVTPGTLSWGEPISSDGYEYLLMGKR